MDDAEEVVVETPSFSSLMDLLTLQCNDQVRIFVLINNFFYNIVFLLTA